MGDRQGREMVEEGIGMPQKPREGQPGLPPHYAEG